MEQLIFKCCCFLGTLAGKGNVSSVSGTSDFLSPPSLSKGSHTSSKVLHTRVTRAASLAAVGSRGTPLCFRKHFRIPRSQDWQGWHQIVELQWCCFSFSAWWMQKTWSGCYTRRSPGPQFVMLYCSVPPFAPARKFCRMQHHIENSSLPHC